MTECVVTCHTCRTDTDSPKSWRWLCEDCATDCQSQHRRETGHDTHLKVTVELTSEEFRQQLHAASVLRRLGVR